MPIPFWCLCIAFVLIYAAKIPVAVGQFRTGHYDNRHPREQQAKLDGWAKRAVAAHTNAFEGFAPFAASVFVAYAAHGDAHYSALLAMTYVGARIVYTALYIGNMHFARSTVWGIGWATTLGLFLLPVLSGSAPTP
jgi:uncharacterized MAPEG superfamily protein